MSGSGILPHFGRKLLLRRQMKLKKMAVASVISRCCFAAARLQPQCRPEAAGRQSGHYNIKLITIRLYPHIDL